MIILTSNGITSEMVHTKISQSLKDSTKKAALITNCIKRLSK